MPLVALIMIQDSKPGTSLPVHPIWSGIRTITTIITGLLAFISSRSCEMGSGLREGVMLSAIGWR